MTNKYLAKMTINGKARQRYFETKEHFNNYMAYLQRKGLKASGTLYRVIEEPQPRNRVYIGGLGARQDRERSWRRYEHMHNLNY